MFYTGTYAPTAGMASSCYDCPLGSYCDPTELTTSTGVIEPVICPAGYYCPLSTEFATQNPCPVGTFSDETSLDSEGGWVC